MIEEKVSELIEYTQQNDNRGKNFYKLSKRSTEDNGRKMLWKLTKLW